MKVKGSAVCRCVSAASIPVVYDEKSRTLFDIDMLVDRDREEEDINLRMGLLNHYPWVRMSKRLADARLYVCKPAVSQVLQEKKAQFDSVREEFMPWLCKVQTQRTKREKYSSGASQYPILESTTERRRSFKPHNQHRSCKCTCPSALDSSFRLPKKKQTSPSRTCFTCSFHSFA